MIIKEIIFLNRACSPIGNGLFVFRPLRLTPHALRLTAGEIGLGLTREPQSS